MNKKSITIYKEHKEAIRQFDEGSESFTINAKKYGFAVYKYRPGYYAVTIAGDGQHFSKSVNGIFPHIRKKIEQIIELKEKITRQKAVEDEQ